MRTLWCSVEVTSLVLSSLKKCRSVIKTGTLRLCLSLLTYKVQGRETKSHQQIGQFKEDLSSKKKTPHIFGGEDGLGVVDIPNFEVVLLASSSKLGGIHGVGPHPGKRLARLVDLSGKDQTEGRFSDSVSPSEVNFHSEFFLNQPESMPRGSTHGTEPLHCPLQ